MFRSGRLRQISFGIGIWILSAGMLALAPQFNSDLQYELSIQIARLQSIIAIGCGLLLGTIVAIFNRSVVAGMMVLAGVVYGLTIGGTLGFTSGYLLIVLLVRKGGTDELLPGFELAILAFSLWFLGQSIGAIWGGISWYKWYALARLNRQSR
jgi:hypothetical protein